MIREFAVASLLVLGAAALTQRMWSQRAPAAQPPPSTHEVNTDHSITFRYRDGSASSVSILTDAALKPIRMSKDEAGMWTATTPALPPSIYGYTFLIDGEQSLDPRNGQTRHSLGGLASEVTVPAEPPAPWELTDIAHGVVSRHVFTTHVAQNLPQNQSAYVVYTPPGYDPKHKGGYPVLYLLHGYTDSEDGWTAVGRANLMLDSMIDSGKAVPMIVVMPLGYGDYTFLTSGWDAWNEPAKVVANVSLFTQMLRSEVIPAVERDYNVAKGRENRAIAGLSMGGLESLSVGLSHPEQFAYVAGFSSAIGADFLQRHPEADAKTTNFRLLWVACGVDDGLIKANRAFTAGAKAKGLPITAIETPGAHTWLVWRDNLLHVAPLLFR